MLLCFNFAITTDLMQLNLKEVVFTMSICFISLMSFLFHGLLCVWFPYFCRLLWVGTPCHILHKSLCTLALSWLMAVTVKSAFMPLSEGDCWCCFCLLMWCCYFWTISCHYINYVNGLHDCIALNFHIIFLTF